MAMSNVEARATHSLSPTSRGAFGGRGHARGKALSFGGGHRRRVVAAGRFLGDVIGGSTAILLASFVASQIGIEGENGLANRLAALIPVTLALLVGIDCLLGVYWSDTTNLMERFRLRSRATLVFAFSAMLVWGREGPTVNVVFVPLVAAAVLVLGCWTEHFIQACLMRSGTWGAPTGILGSGAKSQALARRLMGHPASGLRPVGFIELDGFGGSEPTVHSQDENDPAVGLPVLELREGRGPHAGLETVVAPDSSALPSDPTQLYRMGIRRVLVVNQLGEFPSADVQVRHFDGFVALELSGRPNNPNAGMKRVTDFVIAVPLALFFAPFIGLLAVLIKIVDPGPAFHRQSRIGRHGTCFELLKLRTMYGDAEDRLQHVLATNPSLREEWRMYFKLAQDPRILPYIGHFLRRTSLDELPQLWNVLRGDMSLVGPRPFPAYHMDAFDSEFRDLRVGVTPGLTGLWQVSSRSEGNLDVQRAQDIYYIRNRSLWLDLYILIATLPAVIGGRGAR